MRGRKTGQPHSTPVNPLEIDGVTYPVAPRGNTQRVRNLRAAGEGELHRPRGHPLPRRGDSGRRQAADPEDLPGQVGVGDRGFFDLEKNPSDSEIQRVAPDHPVFRINLSD